MRPSPASSGLRRPATPPRHEVKDERGEHKHLQNGHEPDREPGYAGHPGGVHPSCADMHCHPLGGYPNDQTSEHHKAIACHAGVHEPRVLTQPPPAGDKDAQHQQAIAQACHEAVAPYCTETLHTDVERCLGQFPEIIGEDSHDKENCHGTPELPPVRHVGPLSVWRRSLHTSLLLACVGWPGLATKRPSSLSLMLSTFSPSSRRPPADGGRWRGGGVRARAPCHRGVGSFCDSLGCCPSRSASVPLASGSRCRRRGGSGVESCDLPIPRMP